MAVISAKLELHVLDIGVMEGAAGKTTALIVLSWQRTLVLIEFVGVPPHAAVSLYLALIVQHPLVLLSKPFATAKVPYALKDPPGG
jgi:hypothetical protein